MDLLLLVACILVLIVSVTTFFVWNFIKEYIRYRRLFSLLPGPKSYLFLGNLPDLICDDANFFKNLRRWSREHYPVYKVTAAMYAVVNISGAEDFEIIAATMKNSKKSIFYQFLDLWLGEGLLTSYGSKWQRRRKILTPAFHFSILQQFITVFNRETENLVSILKRDCHKPEINIMPYISQFALSSINETSMGTKLNLKQQEDKSYYSSIHQLGKIFYYRMMRPWLYSDTFFYNLTTTGYKEKNLIKSLHDFTNKIIKKRAEDFETFKVMDNENFNYSSRKNMALLDLLLNAKIRDNLIDDKGIQDEVNTFMFAGHDTVSMALSFTLMLLASHRDVQELIVQEINQVLGESKSQPTYNDLQELKYMERCIKESLRIYPSVPYIARFLEEEIISSSGYILPKGAVVQIHIFDIHRDPKIWPNPEHFDPDRFLPENCQDRHPFAYVPFSAGPRNCIGQRYAILEIKTVLCGILGNFILEPVDTSDTIVLVPDLVLRPEKEIRVKFIPRV